MKDETVVERIVQHLDRLNEAKGEGIAKTNAEKRASMTPEERRQQADRDNRDLFGEEA